MSGIDWAEINAKLPYEKNDEERAARKVKMLQI